MAEKVEELILHVGASKAGSSTIQKYLRKKSQKYADRHEIFFAPQLGPNFLSYATGQSEGINLPSTLNFHPNVVIASFELLFSKINDVSQLEKLRDKLDQLFNNIKIILYLRRQDEVFISSYFTACLQKGAEPFSDQGFTYMPKLNWANKLQMWDEIFGAEALRVRRVGPGYMVENDIIQDFCRAAEVPYIHTVFVRQNQSPPAEIIEFIRLLMKHLEFERLPKTILRSILAPQFSGPKLGLSAVRKQQILDHYQPDNDNIARKYLQDDRLFNHPIADEEFFSPVLSADQVLTTTKEILLYHQHLTEPVPKGLSLDEAVIYSAKRLLEGGRPVLDLYSPRIREPTLSD